MTAEEKRNRHKAAMRKYYQANKSKYKGRYKDNAEAILAVQKIYRDANKDAIRLRDKRYNDTQRNK